MKYRAELGSISTGTLRPEDLIDAFSYELEALGGARYRDLLKEARDVDPDSDDASEIVDELQDALNEYAPDYCYFGAHPGDGADFGFWLCEDFQQMARDDGVLEVSDTAEVPKNYRGIVLHVNDHGNATLYSCSSGQRLAEIWSCV